ncbi:MAG: iron-sulfur cluster repair di-iron protein [Bryobacteraceae bacterium]
MVIETTQTVREIVQQHPAAVRVFEALGIDYCCGGRKSLEDACRKGQVPLEKVLSDLADALPAHPTKEDSHWMTASLGELADYIVEQHHTYARRELTRLTALAEKVFLRHGNMHPELGRVRDLVNAMADEMFTHMFKEEEVLFPQLKAVEGAERIESLIYPMRRMMEDHDDTGELLRNIRLLTSDYQPPVGACMSFQALYHGLSDLERDLHRHIHLENNILVPRAVEFGRTN